MKKGAKIELAFPNNYTTALLMVEGDAIVNSEHKVPQDHFVMFSNDGEFFTVEALNDTVILVLSGEPIHEPIVAHGPFVMNTQEEIITAFQDFNTGKFGYLED